MRGQSKKVYIGMSGGVDSSVSAALLKEQGFDVTGVFIKVWQPDWMECTWREDRLDAMRVAAKIGIPFITIDLEKEYKKEVVDYMIAEYKSGKTPNPDVMCNRYIKFGAFFDWAMKNGADYVATGHYAEVRIKEDKNSKDGDDNKNYILLSGKDAGKDQSYFLWQLSSKKLSKTLFPVGNMEKSEVRKLALKFDLPNAVKKDSQGLCFVGKVDMKEFLSHYIEVKRGDVLDEGGNVIGYHDGAFFLTLGERHGFYITQKGSDDVPLYIVARDIEKNTITVSSKSVTNNLSAEKKAFKLKDVNWISEYPQLKNTYTARVRHLGELLPCVFSKVGHNSACIEFKSPIIISPGQSVVVYYKEECLGGGVLI